MSGALALASATSVLKGLLNHVATEDDVTAIAGDVTISALAPDLIATDNSAPSRLNLFLYEVTPNLGWRNVGLRSHDDRGERLSNPPLALDLHYLLTAYGAQDFHAEALLAAGMQRLHETPVLTRQAIRGALTPIAAGGVLPAELAALATSDLADQIEQIKICPNFLSLENASKLWSVMKAPYRPSVGFQVSVVLIEGKRSVRSPLPVRERRVYVVPFRQPVIERVLSRKEPGHPIRANQPITVGSALVLEGRQLKGDDTEVYVEGVEATLEDAADARIILAIPAGVPSGVRGVSVAHPMQLGAPATERRWVESNVAAFVLRPQLSAVVVTNASTHEGLRSAELTLRLTPDVRKTQRVTLLLNGLDPPARSYSFVGQSRDTPGVPDATDTIVAPVSGVVPGAYLVRVQVDGAESVLTPDTTGRYSEPQVQI